MNPKKNHAALSTITLSLLIIGAIDNIRNLPAAALFGSSLIFFFLFAAVTFLIPISFVSATLATSYPDSPGVFGWLKTTFGEKAGVIGIWLQWISAVVWFPTILSFVAGTAAFTFNPELANNKIYLITVILTSFWGLTLINLRGLETSAKFASFCTALGMLLPLSSVIILGAMWIFTGKPLQIEINLDSIIPHIHKGDSWISLTAIITSFLGMELAAVHVRQIDNPKKMFPKALFIATVIILTTMVLGSLAIAIVLPAKDINLVDGTLQAIAAFLQSYHLGFLLPIFAGLIFIGTLGGLINWLISPAKGLLQVAQAGYLPDFFSKTNKHGVAHRIFILQATLVSLICACFLFMPSINGSYWLMTDLSTQLYMVMYFIVFLAAIYLATKETEKIKSFGILDNKFGLTAMSIAGLIGSITTIVVGFFPPENINVGGVWSYELLIVGGMVVFIAPCFFLKK